MPVNTDKMIEIMREKNMNARNISEISNIPLRTVNNIVSGITSNPTINNLYAISNALECTLDELYYCEEDAKEMCYIIPSDKNKY